MKLKSLFSISSLIVCISLNAATTITTQPRDISAAEGTYVEVRVVGTYTNIQTLSYSIYINEEEYFPRFTQVERNDGGFKLIYGLIMRPELEGSAYIQISDSSGTTQSESVSLVSELPDILLISPDNNRVVKAGDSATVAAIVFNFSDEPMDGFTYYNELSVENYDIEWKLDAQSLGSNYPLILENLEEGINGPFRFIYSLKSDSETQSQNISITADNFWNANDATTVAHATLSSPNFGEFLYSPSNRRIGIVDETSVDEGFGWITITAADPQSVWFYDDKLGWCWTRLHSETDKSLSSIWPTFYSIDHETWLAYANGNLEGREFYNYETDEFVTVPRD